MKKYLFVLVATLLGVGLMAPAAQAADQAIPVATKCASQTGWYVNPDEGDLLPSAQVDGFLFEGKDLVHHETSLDLVDADKTSKGFVASTEGKVVFKMETTAPYSTIIKNADGKYWSTGFKAEAVGSQNQPVEHMTDLVNKPDDMKPGKKPYTADTRVVSFGVGYWTEEGSTLVTSIKFHGVTYDLTCKVPTTSPTSASPTKTTSPTPTKTVKPTRSTSAAPAAGSTDDPSLPVTGSKLITLAILGGVLVVGGGLAIWANRRRRMTFEA